MPCRAIFFTLIPALWYVQVNLYREGGAKHHLVHRLVAAAFLGRVEGYEVNHRDGVKTNNAVENLEIVSTDENRRHAKLTGLLKSEGEKSANAKLTDEKVRRMRRLRAEGVPVAVLARQFGVSRRVVYLVGSRKAWRHVA